MTNRVQIYKSTDLNAPPLSGQAGSQIVVLNACLVDGYGWTGMSITGITRSGTTATATVSAANGLKLKTGMILTISGAVQTDYNITATITVASTTTFTYTVANSPTTPATGTILASSFLPITSITRASTTATVTLTNANTTLVTGDYVTISGAAETDYNVTAAITVTDSTHFTYQVANSPTTPATGTIVYTKPGLQWTRPFSAGTNAQTYLSAATTGANAEAYTPRYLQVIDNAAQAGTGKEAQWIGYETMTADQTGTGIFPPVGTFANGYSSRKSSSADTVTRAWTVCGDQRLFEFIPSTGDTTPNPSAAFGYFVSFKSSDAYNTLIAGASSFNATTGQGGPGAVSFYGVAPTTSNGCSVPRLYTQSGTAVLASFQTGVSGTGSIGSTSILTYPNPVDSGLYVQPVFICDGAGELRGRMPGWYAPLHQIPFTNYDVSTGITGLSGVSLMAINCSTSSVSGQAMVDQFGPWN